VPEKDKENGQCNALPEEGECHSPLQYEEYNDDNVSIYRYEKWINWSFKGRFGTSPYVVGQDSGQPNNVVVNRGRLTYRWSEFSWFVVN
jgi:hypothetical protein